MLKTLKLQNFTVFKEARLKFSPGLNVIIGENGTGKSHLLKLGYAILCTLESFGEKIPPNEVAERSFKQSLVDIFRPETLGRLASRVHGHSTASIESLWGKKGKLQFSFSTRHSEKVSLASPFQYEQLSSSTLFIPPKEILSIFEGFQGALEKRELAFDGTYLALSKALNPAPLRGKRPGDTSNFIDDLEDIIKFSVVKKENRFYLLAKNGAGQFEAQLVAEGLRKLGMLAYLMMNGELRKSSALFWDEPEANLNPRLLAKLAKILVELSKIMQVTIATHSLFLLRELEILQEKQQLQNARYFGLHFAEDGGVEIQQGDSSNDIGDIAALDANLEQSDRYMELSYGEE